MVTSKPATSVKPLTVTMKVLLPVGARVKVAARAHPIDGTPIKKAMAIMVRVKYRMYWSSNGTRFGEKRGAGTGPPFCRQRLTFRYWIVALLMVTDMPGIGLVRVSVMVAPAAMRKSVADTVKFPGAMWNVRVANSPA